MNAKAFGLGLAAAALVATSAMPAQAQVVDDFLCSTFSFHCQEPPPPPPTPAMAPEAAPAEPMKKAKHHAKKKMVKKKAAEPAADAAPAPDAGAPK